jgi:SOS response regulatory protein OraA/RecX
MREKLTKTYNEETAELIVSRLIDEGYINDAKFAAHAAEYMAEVKQFGAYRIKQELLSKGIDKETASDAAARFETADIEIIKSRIHKSYRICVGTPAGERKIQTAMARYGFRFSDVMKAIKEIREEELVIR